MRRRCSWGSRRRCRNEAAATPAHAPLSASVEATVSLLLVDDDAMAREWVRIALRSTEFRVSGIVGSAAEALELSERRRPDLVLIDYRLSDGIGTELVRRLSRIGVAAPAGVMYAHPQAGLNG